MVYGPISGPPWLNSEIGNPKQRGITARIKRGREYQSSHSCLATSPSSKTTRFTRAARVTIHHPTRDRRLTCTRWLRRIEDKLDGPKFAHEGCTSTHPPSNVSRSEEPATEILNTSFALLVRLQSVPPQWSTATSKYHARESAPDDPVFLGGGMRPDHRFRQLCDLAGIKPKLDAETGKARPGCSKISEKRVLRITTSTSRNRQSRYSVTPWLVLPIVITRCALLGGQYRRASARGRNGGQEACQ